MAEEGGSERPTLIRPPPNDPDKAPIENALDVLELNVFGPVSLLIFINYRIHHSLTRLPRTSSPTSGPYGILREHAVSTAVL